MMEPMTTVEVVADHEHQRNERILRGALLVLTALGVALAVTIFHRATHHRSLVDLEVYRKGAWAFIHGRNPYGPGLPGPGLPYTYTPFSTIAFAPLALLGLHQAVLAHTFVSVLALFISAYAVINKLVGSTVPYGWVLLCASLVAPAVYLSEPVQETIGFGQINLVLMTLVVVDLLMMSHLPINGVLVGIAAGIKLTPLVFVIYLIAIRRYRAAAVATASAIGTVALGWVLMSGPSHQYFTDLMFDARRIGRPGYVGNQSLNGMWTRYLRGYLGARPYWALSALVVVIVGIWAASRVYARLGEPAGLAVVALTGLLVSPISWSHHWVWWMVPALVLAHRTWVERSVLLGAATVLWTVPFYMAPFWWVPHKHHEAFPHGQRNLFLGSTYVWVGLIAITLVAVDCLRRELPRRAPTRTQ